jgi:hypothetical protein
MATKVTTEPSLIHQDLPSSHGPPRELGNGTLMTNHTPLAVSRTEPVVIDD